jgi:hypothetical protein
MTTGIPFGADARSGSSRVKRLCKPVEEFLSFESRYRVGDWRLGWLVGRATISELRATPTAHEFG